MKYFLNMHDENNVLIRKEIGHEFHRASDPPNMVYILKYANIVPISGIKVFRDYFGYTYTFNENLSPDPKLFPYIILDSDERFLGSMNDAKNDLRMFDIDGNYMPNLYFSKHKD